MGTCRGLGSALLLTALALTVAPQATADSRAVRNVTAHYDDPGYGGITGLALVPSTCDPAKPGVCAVETHGHATFTGGLSGTTDYRAQGRLDLVGGLLYQEVWETFTGTIAGCGSGSISWYVHGSSRLQDFDPVTQTGPQDLAIDIVAGSGTRDLTGLTGTAATEGTLKVYPGENHGTLTGHFRCTRGRANARCRGRVRSARPGRTAAEQGLRTRGR